ncbi:hypothetical protein IT575_07055 [bacterium]|nr:hypothetical protein [bacterium]
MTMQPKLAPLSGAVTLLLLLTAALLLAPSCNGSGAKGGGKGAVKSSYPPPQEPGVEFTKTSVGLPSQAMDFIGMNGFSLAGAKKSRQVFFAVPAGDEKSDIYVRDLRTGIRAKVASIDRMVPGSMTADQDGKYLVYCRLRETSKYIDDPGIDTPRDISVPYRYDLVAKEEKALFDFRDPQWLPYRNGNLVPLASPDGQRVACLAYDNDLSILGYTADRWLGDFDKIKSGQHGLSPDELAQLKKGMTTIFSERPFSDKLAELGLSAPASEEPSEAQRQMVIKLRDSLPPPQWVMLLWDKGEASLIPVKLAAGSENRMLSLTVVSNSALVLTSASTEAGKVGAEYFTLDQASGALQPLLQLSGMPMHAMLPEGGSELLLLYSPATADAKNLENYSVIRRQPLGGGEGSELKLEQNYASIADLSPDGKQMLAQDQFDRDLYLVDTGSGERQRLMDFVAGSEVGVFLPEGADQGVFLENGILFRFDIPAEPESSPAWRGKEQFKDYDAKAREFLDRLGFSPGEGADSSWEGREGIGLNEYAGVFYDPSHPDAIALLRYDLKRQGFDSLFFPNGYNMDAAPELDKGAVDAYGAEEIAKAALGKVGWLGENAQLFQRGTGPLYDARSDSYVFIYRDGYNLPDSGPWVISTEATVRVVKSSGRIAEMNLASFEPVNEPVLKATDEEIEVAVRNYKETPMPPQAKAFIDVGGKRMVLARPRIKELGPAAYALPAAPKVYYEVDVFLQKGGDLLWTSRVDAETAEVLDQLYFMPNLPNSPQV